MPSLPILKSCLFGDKADAESDNDTTEEQLDAETGTEIEALVGETSRPRSLVTFYECVESFLFGMGRLFPALIVLTLAWATGTIMTEVGADRLFSQVITTGISAKAMPTLAFVIAVVMALATGSSWSTMTILFPLLMVPTYQVAQGDETIFVATVAGVLSGSVAGDHMSPISDTTVISAMSCGCKLLDHVTTQAPYSLLIVVLCILFGTIPIGFGANSMPNAVGILLGFVFLVAFIYFVAAPVNNPSGRYDIFTEMFLKCFPNPGLEELRKETILFNDASNKTSPSQAMTDDNDDMLDQSKSQSNSTTKGSCNDTYDDIVVEELDTLEEVQV
jgi:hypothetical protein